jgi:hypothetical protein
MKFTIHKTNRYNVSASLDDVVYLVSYQFYESGSSAVEGEFNYESTHYHLKCDSVSSDNYISYNSATSSMKNWIQDSHGANWGAFTSSIQTSLNSTLSSRTSSDPTDVITWTSGSLILNPAMLSGTTVEHF